MVLELIIILFLFVVFCSAFAGYIYHHVSKVRYESYKDFLERQHILTEKFDQKRRKDV